MKKKTPKVAGGGLSAAEIAKLTGTSVSWIYAQLTQGRSAFEILMAAQRRQQRETPLVADLNELAPLVNGRVPVNGSLPSYSASLARKEALLADLRQTELAQKRRELMPVSYMRIWGLQFLTEAKDLWLKGPSELRDQLAAESDPLRCEVLLRDFCERVVDRLYKLERLWQPPGSPPEAA